MSVLIKMEMPKSCAKCKLFGEFVITRKCRTSYKCTSTKMRGEANVRNRRNNRKM